MKPNHKCDPARMALLYIRQQFICTTFKFDAYLSYMAFESKDIYNERKIFNSVEYTKKGAINLDGVR